MENVFDFIVANETAYRSTPISIADGYDWSMYEHVRKSLLYKNSKFYKGPDDNKRPFKNIILPILNVAYRAEGFDVKDIEPFVDDPKNYYKSFFVRKFYPRWARENDLDTFIDELVESYVDYGLALVKSVNEVRPIVIPLESLAFVDQTDVLTGPICIKHAYSVDELQDMGWDKDAVEQAILRATSSKEPSLAQGQTNKTPSKYIEVYELHGVFPKKWLMDEDAEGFAETADYLRQMHLVSFFNDKDGEKKGVTFFKAKQKQLFKAIKRDSIYGRACGRGGIEEIFDPQQWTNFSEIHIQKMLKAASLMLLKTTDKKFATANKISDLDENEILHLDDGKDINELVITPRNKVAFDNSSDRWLDNARTLGSANEAVLGESPASGTPFRLQALVVQEGKGIHTYRQGQVSTFVAELHRDWFLQHLVKEMNKGQTWLEELAPEELREVADAVVTQEVNGKLKEMIMKGKQPTPEEQELLTEVTRENFLKGGRKRFIEIVKGELKDIPVDVRVNIAGKQKNLAEMVDKLVNIWRAIVANPAVLQAPGMSKLFNEILEGSGFSPVDFAGIEQIEAPVTGAQGQESPAPAVPTNEQ